MNPSNLILVVLVSILLWRLIEPSYSLSSTSNYWITSILAIALGSILGIRLSTSSSPSFISLILIALFGSKSKTKSNNPDKEPFDLSHQLINLDTSPKASSWVNLGYWKTAQSPTSYTEAAADLARQLALEADLSPNQTILDVGFGCGDQDILFVKEFNVKKIIGINISHSQTEFACQKVAAHNLNDRIQLIQGDATQCDEIIDQKMDRVLALDTAYHFGPSRLHFFKAAYKVLKQESGRIALADICLSNMPTSFLGQWLMKKVCRACFIPEINLRTVTEYESDLVAAGFINPRIRKCDPSDVFLGFVEFMNRKEEREVGIWNMIKPLSWLKFRVTALFLRQVVKYETVDFIFASADMP